MHNGFVLDRGVNFFFYNYGFKAKSMPCIRISVKKNTFTQRRKVAKVFFFSFLLLLFACFAPLRENFGSRLYQNRFNLLSARMTGSWVIDGMLD